MVPFQVLEVSYELNRSLRPVLERLRLRDRSAVDQIRRAGASVSQNLAEGNQRGGKDRPALWRVAAGSAAEVRAALRVAEAFGDLDTAAIEKPLELVDRVLAMTWKLTHR